MLTAVYDANVLYPAPLRDLLVRLARTGMFHGRWTNRILDEVFASLRTVRPDLDPAALDRTRRLICEAVPDCLIEGWESAQEGLVLPDPDDRHVLAAAIYAEAQVIVTANLKDFPGVSLAPWGIEAKPPDTFVLELIDIDPDAVSAVVRQQQQDLVRRPTTIAGLLDILERQGLPRSVTALRTLLLDP